MTEEKNLIELIKEIDPNLKFEKVLGRGGYCLVAKVVDGRNTYRLKINRFAEPEGMPDTLEREYSILEDLSKKTNISPRTIKLYENVPSLYENKKGKNAYLTEFIEGEVLSKSEKQSEISLIIGLMDLMGRIHHAGYKFGKNADLNADNILLGKDGKLYLIDPMYLVPLKEKIPFGMTKEEREKVNEIIRRYSY